MRLKDWEDASGSWEPKFYLYTPWTDSVLRIVQLMKMWKIMAIRYI